MEEFKMNDIPFAYLCKNCNRPKGMHKAKTLNCPIGRGNFHSYHQTQFFAPKNYSKNKNSN